MTTTIFDIPTPLLGTTDVVSAQLFRCGDLAGAGTAGNGTVLVEGRTH